MSTAVSPPLAVYYEHPEWFNPLFALLDKRGISFTKIDAASHSFDAAKSDYPPVFFNRMSASAYLRGHGNAIFYSHDLLKHLEDKGVRVLNGYESFVMETSKALQLSLLERIGIAYPRSRVINSPKQAVAAAKEIGFPVIIKPNIGGRGTGIVRFNSEQGIEEAVKTDQLDLGPDSVALIQEFIPKREGRIQRIETLGGKLLYGMHVYTPDENFNLCPAEVCQTEDRPAELCIVDAPKAGIRVERFEPEAEIVEKVEKIIAASKIDVGGVEYLIDDRTGEAVFYDINALSNFVGDAVNILGFDPHENLVDFLEKEIKKCVTGIGSLSSAVG